MNEITDGMADRYCADCEQEFTDDLKPGECMIGSHGYHHGEKKCCPCLVKAGCHIASECEVCTVEDPVVDVCDYCGRDCRNGTRQAAPRCRAAHAADNV